LAEGYKRRLEDGELDFTVALGVVRGDEKEVSNLRQYNMVTSSTGLGPENDCAGEDQKQL
jgi:hypothetical protein